MIVPEFWAEGRARGRRDTRQVTVRRFGWSDASQADAQAIADARAAEALEQILSGEPLDRRELKVPYSGAEGLPIREEIVGRYGDTIITRNSYGARCLNSPRSLFADIDFPPPFRLPVGCAIVALAAGAAAVIQWLAGSPGWAIGLGVVAILAALPVGAWIGGANWRSRGGREAAARTRVGRFVDDHVDWALRVYRTPAGLRLLVTHQPFDPNDPAVLGFFAHIRADPVYVQMCLNQQCFRARVSPKPWRIGINRHMRGGA
ncbi:MAG TPA: hypothetical protein VKE40_15470, partial [Gemmataceae bacterium]|nr:hypothetical protein [Gemmataceae bacterium]